MERYPTLAKDSFVIAVKMEFQMELYRSFAVKFFALQNQSPLSTVPVMMTDDGIILLQFKFTHYSILQHLKKKIQSQTILYARKAITRIQIRQ